MKKKIIFLLLVFLVLLVISGLALIEVALETIRETDRLGLIRATKDLAIPEWLKLWIWGWR